MTSLPIRIRLTLWYFLTFASAGLMLSTASWWMLHRSIDASEYHDLQERAEDVQLLLSHQGANRSMAELQQQFAAIYNIKDDGKWLQVEDQDGNWIYRSKRMIAENPPLPLPSRLPADGTIGEFHQGTREVRTLSYPIMANGKLYSVQTGIALNKSIALLGQYRINLLWLTPGAILLAAVCGHLMSRKALKPVAALADEARHINDRNLDKRLPVSSANDEISDLSNTLNQMLERIDKAFASVRAFTGNASHELRTPISILRTEIEVALQRPREAAEYRTTLSLLHEETIRMTNLIEHLLALARSDAGAEKITLAPFRVNSLLVDVTKSWHACMLRSMLDFRAEFVDDEVLALGDINGISRLLAILLDNSTKYTPPGGSVVLRARQENDRIVFSVRDTGVGVSREDQPRIFERFYRSARLNERGASGSGLGLALGKWIAERHGTQLGVKSEPGHGSEFSFSLELLRIDQPETRDVSNHVKALAS